MERRSFLKLAIGAAVVVASGMELLETKEKPLVWNPQNYRGDFEFKEFSDTLPRLRMRFGMKDTAPNG
jgi:3'-phosphoadenosine 5'-phosphosulfate (PAPS) 3'-phosphatase